MPIIKNSHFRGDYKMFNIFSLKSWLKDVLINIVLVIIIILFLKCPLGFSAHINKLRVFFKFSFYNHLFHRRDTRAMHSFVGMLSKGNS